MNKQTSAQSEPVAEVVTATGKSVHLKPLDVIGGFDVRPGFYEINGATAIPCGVNFTVYSHGAVSCELLLFSRGETEPYAVLKFPKSYKIGNVYSMIVFGLDIMEFEYAYRMDGPCEPSRGLIFDKSKFLLDPYAKAVVGQSGWGRQQSGFYKARVVQDDFDWGIKNQSGIPMHDLIIYETHVRGFTMHGSSGVSHPGTFSGLSEKIPYLKELGINAVELMPIFEFDETQGRREIDGQVLLDYWGYNPVCFFAPNTSYTANLEYNREGQELKQLVKSLHENGIEIFLDVVFNHTAEGNEDGPYFSFKGFDNNIYYMLTPDGSYYNFSGCGNTMNCNHPIVQQFILECLRYWVIAYRIDGFRFDLASILGRSEDSSPMSNPPLLQSLAFDPILGNVKLIAEAWDAGGLYQVGSFPSWSRWAEWNGKYRDDLRSYLKGDYWYLDGAAACITGSEDIYNPEARGNNVSVNFLTCHDGFTLHDLYTYQEKHNESNGWDSTDGHNDNRSWNCGIEGETDDPVINAFRIRMMKNACAALMCSRGTPMFLAGDEFGNSQFGNNNAYCQDNEISWLNWTDLDKNKELYDFFRYMIRFRLAHNVLRTKTGACSCSFPDVSVYRGEHCLSKEQSEEADEIQQRQVLGILFAGQKSISDGPEKNKEDDILFLAINSYWEQQSVTLPVLPPYLGWRIAVNTAADDPEECAVEHVYEMKKVKGSIEMAERSVVILIAR